MPIKITVSVTGKDGKKTELVHKVALKDLGNIGVTRKEAKDSFYMDEAVQDHVLNNMIKFDYEKVKR